MTTTIRPPRPAAGGVPRSAVSRLRDALAAVPQPVYVDVDQLPAEPGRERSVPGVPTYPVRVGAGRVYLGPLSDCTPGGGPCATCFDLRWAQLRIAEEQRALAEGVRHERPGPDDLLTPAALEKIRLIAEHDCVAAPGGPGPAVSEVDLTDLSVRRLPLLAHSDCPVCSAPMADGPDVVYQGPVSAPKERRGDYRLRSAADIPLPEKALVNDVCGAIGAREFTVYQCTATLPVSGFFRVRSRFDYHDMWWSGQSQSSRSSHRYGLLEGLERYAGQYPRARTTTTVASLAELGGQAFDPRALGEYPQRFYDHHAESYERLTDDTRLPWVWGWSLGSQRSVLVPEQIAYYLDRTPARKFVQECSSGCASGSSRDEAVLHGILELIERDAFLLNWYGGAVPPEISVASCRDARIQHVVDRIDRLGYDVRFFDIRVDIPVPTVMAVAERRDGGIGTLCFAAGSSFDPMTAVWAALSEVASYVPGLDERVLSRADELRGMVDDYSQVTELTHHSLLYGLPEMRSVPARMLQPRQEHPLDTLHADWLRTRPWTLDLADDVRYLVEQVCRSGDLVVVDQTTPEHLATGVRTVATVAGGLIPIDFGWDRQRALGHPRLSAFLSGELPLVPRPVAVPTSVELTAAPHPFP